MYFNRSLTIYNILIYDYLKDTGVYHIGDIGFAVLDVWDDEPEKIPDPDNIVSNTKVLLYHGTVDKSKTDLGYAITVCC